MDPPDEDHNLKHTTLTIKLLFRLVLQVLLEVSPPLQTYITGLVILDRNEMNENILLKSM